MSKRITSEEMLQVGFINKIFNDVGGGGDAGEVQERFLAKVVEEVGERLGEHLNAESLVRVKAIIRKPEREMMDGQTVAEVMGGLERFAEGVPQEEFRKIASGEKRHKL